MEQNMKIVVAIDSLKGSLSSLEAGQAIEQGIRRVLPDAHICVRPMADGGEGTVEALTLGMGGRLETVSVTGPLGKPVNCTYGILPKQQTAVIEMSGAAGITLVPQAEQNPLYTTTYGVGETIKDAMAKGCRHFIVGIGGSATNDGGIGMLQALGFGMLGKDAKQVPFGANGLNHLTAITDEHILPELSECDFRVACDVRNVLCGEKGCSAVFGPQKGATPEMIGQMDEWLAGYAALTAVKYGKSYAKKPGTGAAGGLGFAFLSYLNAVLEPGVKIILEETCLEDEIKDADLVVTGEGQLDGQSIMGKAPVGVAAIAKKYDIPVIAFSGCVSKDAVLCNTHGIDAFFPILRNIQTLPEAMKQENAAQNMRDTAEQVFRLIRLLRA